MMDVTDSIYAFREIARHVWNTSFRNSAEWDQRDDFDQLCAALFRAAVLRPIGFPEAAIAASSDRSPKPLQFLRVIPSIEGGTPILINRTSPRSGYWDDPVKTVKASDVDLRFVRFFDWDELGQRDFAYIEVVVQAFPQHPDLVGRAALLSAHDAKVMVAPDEL